MPRPALRLSGTLAKKLSRSSF